MSFRAQPCLPVCQDSDALFQWSSIAHKDAKLSEKLELNKACDLAIRIGLSSDGVNASAAMIRLARLHPPRHRVGAVVPRPLDPRRLTIEPIWRQQVIDWYGDETQREFVLVDDGENFSAWASIHPSSPRRIRINYPVS